MAGCRNNRIEKGAEVDPRWFDDLTRLLAAPRSRRGFLGSLAALAAGLLGGRAADAQVTQAQCGNVVCAANPGICKPGCVCCVYPNGNSRCRPPQECTAPGTVATTTTTIAPTTTTVAPVTTTTAAPTTTTTTAGPTTTTTTAGPTTTSTTTAVPINPTISVVVTPFNSGGLRGFFVDVSGTGFTPNGTVEFDLEDLFGDAVFQTVSTVADSSGAFASFRLNNGTVAGCTATGFLEQARVIATDDATGSFDEEEVDVPCEIP